MVAPSSNEQVRYDILIEAKQAIKNLRDIMKATEDNTTKMQLFTALVLDSAEKWKMSWQQALLVYKQLNGEMAKQKKGSLFGQTGGKDIAQMSNDYLQAAENAGRLGVATNQLPPAINKVGTESQSAFSRVFNSVNAVRIALGALISMLLFQAIQAVSGFVQSAVQEFTELEDSMWRLVVAEKALSEQGIEISMEDFRDGIKEIRDLLPIFSEQDISGMVGKIAISTKELGYTKEQIVELAKSIAILNVVSTENEDINQTAGKVITALLSGTTKGVSGLGVQLNDTVIKTKAMQMGFLEAGESLDELTKREKDLVKLQIVLDTGNDSLALAGDYLDTNSAKLKENAASVDDLKTAWGGFMASVVPAFTPLVQLITDAVNSFKAFTVIFEAVRMIVVNIVNALGTGANAIDAIRKGIIAFKDIPKIFDEVASEKIPSLFTEIPENAPNWFKNLFGKYLTDIDTATAKTQDFQDELDEFDTSGFKSKIEDIIEDTANAREDLATNLNRKLEDLDEEYRRKAADAETDYLRKVEDINRDFEDDIGKIKTKQRQEDLRDEEKYQLALWELRMRFLMDLEDALHARDARQVLRLQKQYAIDKEALERKKALDDKTREDNQRAELADAKQKRDERLADAKREYQQKLADQQIAKQRELDDLNLWYEREQADIELAQQRKLETLIKGWIDEKKITEANAAEVYGILSKYFGPGGLTDSLYAYMMNSLIASTQGAISAAMSGYSVGGGLADASSGGSVGGRNMGGKGGRNMGGLANAPLVTYGFAEGGSLLATRPTTATFGEGGPELVNFTPLNRVGKNINKVFGDTSGMGGVNGTIRVAVDLSPDLQGRIVEQSLDGVAEVLSKVNRSKI